jgi:hypothetical protein
MSSPELIVIFPNCKYILARNFNGCCKSYVNSYVYISGYLEVPLYFSMRYVPQIISPLSVHGKDKILNFASTNPSCFATEMHIYIPSNFVL